MQAMEWELSGDVLNALAMFQEAVVQTRCYGLGFRWEKVWVGTTEEALLNHPVYRKSRTFYIVADIKLTGGSMAIQGQCEYLVAYGSDCWDPTTVTVQWKPYYQAKERKIVFDWISGLTDKICLKKREAD